MPWSGREVVINMVGVKESLRRPEPISALKPLKSDALFCSPRNIWRVQEPHYVGWQKRAPNVQIFQHDVLFGAPDTFVFICMYVTNYIYISYLSFKMFLCFCVLIFFPLKCYFFLHIILNCEIKQNKRQYFGRNYKMTLYQRQFCTF